MQSNKLKKNLKIVLPILLIIIVLILLFVFPGYLKKSHQMQALDNKKLNLRDQNSLADRLSEKDKTLETTFKNNFIKPFLDEKDDSKYEGIITSIELDKQENKTENYDFLLDDQLLWGKYLVLTEQKKDFSDWQKMIEKIYRFEDSWVVSVDQNGKALETTKTTWPYDLKYAEVLLLSYNQEPSQDTLGQINQIKDKLLPVFTKSTLPANTTMKVERILYPETSSSSKPTENLDLIDPYMEEEFIQLSDVNLYVLESFALLDENWQAPYDQWSEIFTQAISDSENVFFYPIGISSDLDYYISSGEQAFSALTWENVKILYQSPEKLQNPELSGFYKRQILQTSFLNEKYHNVSLQSLSNNSDVASIALFSEYLNQSQEKTADLSKLNESIKNGLTVLQYKNKFNDLNGLFSENTEEGKLLFTAKNQISVLNSGLFE